MKLIDNRKILHSYNIVFYQYFVDELILHPRYDLLWTLGEQGLYFNSAMNFNLSVGEFAFELQYIETFYRNRQRRSVVGLMDSEIQVGFSEIIAERGYKYIRDEDIEFWRLGEKRSLINITEKLSFEIVADYEDFQVYIETAKTGWQDRFEYKQFADSLSKRYLRNIDGVQNFHMIAFVDEEPVATATLSICLNVAHLINVSVKPKYRRKGVASSMIKYAFNLANSRAVEDMIICIDKKDSIAGAVLRRNNFIPFMGIQYYEQQD